MNPTMPVIFKILAVIWAAPTSFVGLLILIAFGGGARVRRTGGAFEVWGPGIQHMFERFSPIGAQAMAIGHIVMGTDPRVLEAVRRHELVHVRQAECLGPFFLPFYLAASAWIYLKGGDWYRENPFEIQAYSVGGSGDWHFVSDKSPQNEFPFWPIRLALFMVFGFGLAYIVIL